MAGVEVIDISLHGGPPWGLRLFGGNGEPLMLSKIRKQSEASEAGLQEGDVIIAINGFSCETMTHSAAMQLIDSSGDTLNFMIVRGGCSADDIRRTLQSMSGSLKTLADSGRRSSDHAPLMTSSNVPMTSSGVGGYNGVHGGISSSQIGGLAEPGLSYLPAPTGPRPASGWTPKVKAPAGVTVTEHQDKSITLGLGFSLSDNKENTTPAKPIFKPDVSQAVWKPSVTPIAAPIKLPINDDFETTFQHDVIAEDSKFKPSNLLLSRIVGESSENESGSESPGYAQRKKKIFADSAFYDDASANYPTIDEQIKMAHLVAQQLMAPANKRARGHQMFMKRRQRSERWVAGVQQGGSDEEDGDDKYYQADPWKHGGGGAWQPTGQGLSAGGLDGGLPAHIWSAHVVPEGSKETKAMSAEEIERMRLYSQKNEHTGVSPQVCFNIANDLKNMKGRGGKIFAKRQARSEKWVHDGGDSGQPEDGGQSQGPAPPTSTRPNKDFMAKLEGTLANRKPPPEEGPLDKGPAPATAPRNRLKEMIDPPKAKMTPWDAWAEYGSLEPAFEHLPTYFKQRDALGTEEDQPAPLTPASGGFSKPASGGTGGGFSKPASAGFSTSSAGGFSAETPATAPFKPVNFAPSSAATTAPTGNSSTGFSSSSGSAPTPAAKPAGFRPVRFNPGSGDVGGLSSLQAAPAAVDVGFCDL